MQQLYTSSTNGAMYAPPPLPNPVQSPETVRITSEFLTGKRTIENYQQVMAAKAIVKSKSSSM